MGRVEVSATKDMDKPSLSAMLQVYLSELSALAGEKIEDSPFKYGYLDAYWIEQNRWPFWIVSDSRKIGFALVRTREDSAFEMAEFYVDPAYRRGGIGSKAARLLFRRFPGKWRISEFRENTVAVMFWRNLAADFGYAERFVRGRVEQSFDTSRGTGGKQLRRGSPQI